MERALAGVAAAKAVKDEKDVSRGLGFRVQDRACRPFVFRACILPAKNSVFR